MKRITKAQAKRLFAAGKPVIFCPCKMHPGRPWSMGATIHPKEHLERAEQYADGHSPQLWKGTLVETAWALAYNAWAFYNCTWETGRYAHYYVE